MDTVPVCRVIMEAAVSIIVQRSHVPRARLAFFQTAQLTKIETPVNLCQATGDPHYTTFDGKYYDFYKPGDYVLYRNLERFFEIHTRLWTCWSVTCNCGVAIREHNDVIVLDTCTQDLVMRNGMPMKIRIPSGRKLRKGTYILGRHPGGYSEYESG